MTCIKNNSQGAEILMDYCAGTLDVNRAAELTAHIRDCAECRDLVEAQEAVWKTLDTWTPAEVSPDFDAQLYARIAREQAQPVWRQWWQRVLHPAGPRALWKPLMTLAAAGAVLSLALMIHDPDVSAPPAEPSQVRANQRVDPRIDADQVEQALDDLDLLIPVGSAASSPL